MTSKTAKTRSAKASAQATAHDAVRTFASGAREAFRTVETMPPSQRQTMATASLGAGAVLWVVGAPRLLTFLAFLPAIAVGGLKVARGHGLTRNVIGPDDVFDAGVEGDIDT